MILYEDYFIVVNDLSLSCCAEPQPYGSALFGQGEGLVKIGGFRCFGDEEGLLKCDYSASDCGHQHDAAVICADPSCISGAVRLVSGLTEYEGTVEVCHNSSWVTICDLHWSYEDAAVVCRQLGYSVIGKNTTSIANM